MKIKFYFSNSSEDDIWICLDGPTARSSGCHQIKAGCKDCGIDYEATRGLDEPNGKWVCNVFDSDSACAWSSNPLARMGVQVNHDAAIAKVNWFFTRDGFGDPPSKVTYEN